MLNRVLRMMYRRVLLTLFPTPPLLVLSPRESLRERQLAAVQVHPDPSEWHLCDPSQEERFLGLPPEQPVSFARAKAEMLATGRYPRQASTGVPTRWTGTSGSPTEETPA
jgi:hypothetical protein